MKNQKIYTCLITLLLFIFCNVSYSQCKSDLEKEKINGSVKEIKETGKSTEDGEVVIVYIKITKYDKKGKALGYSFASNLNDLKPKKTVFEFDQQGNKIKEIRYDLTGNIENYLTYEIDTDGNVIKSRYFTSDDSLDSYSNFKYNQTCDRIEAKHYYSDGNIWLWYKLIYEKGIHTETLSPLDSTISKYTYDNQNNLVEYIEFDKFRRKQKVRTYMYKYDGVSNWLKKITYEDGEITWIDERKLIYHD